MSPAQQHVCLKSLARVTVHPCTTLLQETSLVSEAPSRSQPPKPQREPWPPHPRGAVSPAGAGRALASAPVNRCAAAARQGPEPKHLQVPEFPDDLRCFMAALGVPGAFCLWVPGRPVWTQQWCSQGIVRTRSHGKACGMRKQSEGSKEVAVGTGLKGLCMGLMVRVQRSSDDNRTA